MTAWTRAEVLAFVARWSRLGVPRAEPRPMGVYDLEAVTISINGVRFGRATNIEYRTKPAPLGLSWPAPVAPERRPSLPRGFLRRRA